MSYLARVLYTFGIHQMFGMLLQTINYIIANFRDNVEAGRGMKSTNL